MVAQSQSRFERLEQKIKETPPKSWGKLGAGVTLGGIAFGWVAFPYILDIALNMMVTLKEGNDLRGFWEDLPQVFVFRVYFFNVTNPDEVHNGGIPALQEVGPYVYHNYKKKANLVDNSAEDTVTYSHVNTWYFKKELTYPLTGEEMITLPHLPLMSMLIVGQNDFPTPMLSVLNAAVPGIYGNLKTAFMTARAREYLFDGLIINCTAKNIVPKIVCVALKQNTKGLEVISNNVYKFSFFGPRNATPEDTRLTVMKGTKGGAIDIGKVVAVDGQPYISIWGDGDCRTLKGSDSTIFPPYRRPNNNSLVAFSSELCRVITGTYLRESEYRKIPGHLYSIGFGDMMNNPADKCYCPSPTKCYKKGTTDLMKCIGAPVIATKPHFLDADESYLAGVTGLSPNRDIHDMLVLMEPLSGTPLMARKRVQMNIEMQPIPFANLTKKLRKTMLPLCWLEESLDLDGELMNFLQANLLNSLLLVDIVKWGLIGVGGAIGIVGAARAVSQRNTNKNEEPEILNKPKSSVFGSKVVHGKDNVMSSRQPSVYSVGMFMSPPISPESFGSGRSSSSHGPQRKDRNYPPPISPIDK